MKFIFHVVAAANGTAAGGAWDYAAGVTEPGAEQGQSIPTMGSNGAAGGPVRAARGGGAA